MKRSQPRLTLRATGEPAGITRFHSTASRQRRSAARTSPWTGSKATTARGEDGGSWTMGPTILRPASFGRQKQGARPLDYRRLAASAEMIVPRPFERAALAAVIHPGDGAAAIGR